MSLIPSWLAPHITAVKFAAAGIALAAAFTFGCYVTAEVKDTQILALQNKQLNGEIDNLVLSNQTTDALNNMSHAIDVQLTGLLADTRYNTLTIIKEVPKHVTPEIDRAYPVPCGVIRLRDAAILKTTPAGVVSDACRRDADRAPVAASALSQDDVYLIGQYYEVLDERDALIKWGKQTLKIWDDYKAKVEK